MFCFLGNTLWQSGNPVRLLQTSEEPALYGLVYDKYARSLSLSLSLSLSRVFLSLTLPFSTLVPLSLSPHWFHHLGPSPSDRKRQLQFHLEGRGRRPGQSPEELRENGKLLGEGLSRALFNYPCRDGASDSEVGHATFALPHPNTTQTPPNHRQNTTQTPPNHQNTTQTPPDHNPNHITTSIPPEHHPNTTQSLESHQHPQHLITSSSAAD